MTMKVGGCINYKSTEIKGSSNDTNMSTEEKVEKYFKELQKKYTGIDLKQNSRNVSNDYKVTVTLSPDLLKKAVKDPKVDKNLKMLLNDANKKKNRFKSFNCSKDGHEVKSVSFFMDARGNISCNIKLKKEVSPFATTKDEKKIISRMIEREKMMLAKENSLSISMYSKYINLLSENKFSLIDTVV